MANQAGEHPARKAGGFLVGQCQILEKTSRSFRQRWPANRMSTTTRPGRWFEAREVDVDEPAPSSSTLFRTSSINISLAVCESARFKASPSPLDLFGLVPGDGLIIRSTGIGPRRPPVAGVVGLAVIEPAERLKASWRVAASGASMSLLIRPSTACELCIAWRARAAPGRASGSGPEGSQASRGGVQCHQSLDRHVRHQRIVVGRTGDDRLGRLDLAEPAQARRPPGGDPGIGVGEAFKNGAAGMLAASSLRSASACSANSRTMESTASFTSVANRPASQQLLEREDRGDPRRQRPVATGQ